MGGAIDQIFNIDVRVTSMKSKFDTASEPEDLKKGMKGRFF